MQDTRRIVSTMVFLTEIDNYNHGNISLDKTFNRAKIFLIIGCVLFSG
jgi:hypothetical protein